MWRVSPGTVGIGPAAVPSITSLVPVTPFRAACTFLSAASSASVWAAKESPATNTAGIVAKPASRLRRERLRRLDVSVTLVLLGNSLCEHYESHDSLLRITSNKSQFIHS